MRNVVFHIRTKDIVRNQDVPLVEEYFDDFVFFHHKKFLDVRSRWQHRKGNLDSVSLKKTTSLSADQIFTVCGSNVRIAFVLTTHCT
jgi:hypothetical protein